MIDHNCLNYPMFTYQFSISIYPILKNKLVTNNCGKGLESKYLQNVTARKISLPDQFVEIESIDLSRYQ